MLELQSAQSRTSTIPTKFVAWWNAVSARFNPVFVIVFVWAVLALPLVIFRGFNSDDGVAVTIARTALEDGNWLVPHVFNVRFVERPTLLSWIIAAISAPFGSVTQLTARLPVVLSLLGGCLLIYTLLRRVSASAPAALLGAALFLACPLVLRAYVAVTADLPLAVLLFSAFVLWWIGHASGSISLGRWIAIGIVLALAGLMKGPQPVVYFAFGVGLFTLGTRSWRQIPGLVLAGVICVIPLAAWYWYVYSPGDEGQWALFMRLRASAPLSSPITAALELFAETLPATLFASAFLIAGGLRGTGRVPAAFVQAVASYAFVSTVVILFWPGGSTARYYFPMVLPLCVLGGLAYDALSARRPKIVAPLLTGTLGILAYALVYSVASPLMPERFRPAQLDAIRITALVRAEPAPIYRTGATGLNVFPYVPARVLNTDLQTLEKIPGPAWIAVPIDQAGDLAAKRPNAFRVVTSFGSSAEWRLLRLDR